MFVWRRFSLNEQLIIVAKAQVIRGVRGSKFAKVTVQKKKN